MRFGLSQAIERKEDLRFLTGKGRYTADINLEGQLWAYFVRSPHAAARIKGIDLKAAKQAPGVKGGFTANDLRGLGSIPCDFLPEKGMQAPVYPLLADKEVRFVGQAVAILIGDDLKALKAAANLVEIEYEAVAVVADLKSALKPNAPLVWPEASGNISFRWEMGDKKAVHKALAEAAHIVELELVNNRVIPNPLETRSGLAAYDAQKGFTFYTGSQGVHSLRKWLAGIFKLPEEQFRVITPDVGGGFGLRLFIFPEYPVLLWAARLLGRPVKWVAERMEDMALATHGRDNLSRARLGLDKKGQFLGLEVKTFANMGAYLSQYAGFVPTLSGTQMLAGLYTTPFIHAEIEGIYTNTAPVDAYRGAGRPEAAYLLERLVDKAARQLGISPIEIRKRNFIPKESLPYKTALGAVYDSGDFSGNLDHALEISAWKEFPVRKAESKARGQLRGIGLATYVESCGGSSGEAADIRFTPQGYAEIRIGTQSSGQGHETAYAQILGLELGIPLDKIKVIQGDSAEMPTGGGTGGSRSLPIGGPLIAQAAEMVLEKAKIAASQELGGEAEFKDGLFFTPNSNHKLSLSELLALGHNFDLKSKFKPKGQTYPNGCHVCELEIDPATGKVKFLAYNIVDDFGVVVNPLLLAGQVYGGVAQGIGQALLEECVYDPETGQLLSGSLIDYALPRADDLPFINLVTRNFPTTANPLGIKGAGEAGSIGAPPAVINAIIDALSEFGITHIDMPASSEKIWRALKDAR